MPKAQPSVLICGTGIAGSTLAYWLKRYGFAPTLLERAPSFTAAAIKLIVAAQR